MKKKRDLNVIFTVFILLTTALFGIYVVKNLYFDSTFYAFLDRTSPTLIASEAIAKKYGDTTTIMVLLPFDPDRAEESLREVDNVVRALEKVPFVQSVESLFNAQKNGGLLLGAPFIRFQPYVTVTEDSENPGHRKYAFDRGILQDRAYSGILISEDGRSVTVMLRKRAEMRVSAIELSNRLQSEIRSVTSLPFKLIGEDIVEADLFDSVRVLAFVYTPLIGFVVLGIFLLKFRSLFLTLLTLVPPLLSSIWVYFFMLVFHRNINSLTVLIPTFIVIIGSAYGMHYLSRFLEVRKETERRSGGGEGGRISSASLSATVKQASREEWMPILFSALTTMAGFASNIFLQMEAFRDMGIFASLGIFLCAVFTMVVTPSFLYFYRKSPAQKQESSIRARSTRESRFGRYLKWAFIGFTAIGIGLSPFLIPQVSLEMDSYRYFKESSTLRQSANQLKADFGWVSNMYLVFETPEGRPLSIQSEGAQKIKTFLDQVERIPQIANQMSIVKMSESLKIPMPLLVSATRMSAQGKEMTRPFITEDSFRVMLFLTSNDSAAAKEVKSGIESAWEDAELANDYTIRLTGAPLVWAELSA
ncbi:MAG TPA: MMPL family transporter, partial [Thermotogota bacterium]|nr:MMPL family transporter [Thermotogota bacterium]